MYPFDLTRPPFKLIARQNPEDAAVDIVLAFDAIRMLPDKVSQTFDAIIQCADTLQQTPLVVAGQRLSRDIDSGVGAGHGNAYHNAQHFCEVMLGTHFLALLDNLDTSAQLEVVLGALIHDFHHDGKGNGQIPFKLERIAVDESAPYLVQARVPELQQRLVAALVLATEAAHGLPAAHACHAHHEGGSTLPEIHFGAPELAQLAAHPLFARQALIVCEADALPSVGLTNEYAMQLQDSLSVEWGVSLGAKDKYRFITKVFPGFIIGGFFQPNVEHLRQFLLRRMNNEAAR